MRNLFFIYFYSLLVTMLFMSGCSSSIALPEAVRGEWQQEDDPSFLLKIEQKGKKGEVSFWVFNKWSTPFKIKQKGINKWSFKNDTIAISQNFKYATTIGGEKQWLLEKTELSRERIVEITLNNGHLTAEGLWLSIKNEEWDLSTGKPKKQDIKPISTRFTKATPFPVIPAEVSVKGILLGPNGSPLIGVQVFVVPFDESTENEISPKASSETDAAGQFEISVPCLFFEKAWWNGYKEFVLSYAEEGAEQRLVPTYRTETVPFKLEKGKKEYMLGDVKDVEDPQRAYSSITPLKLLKSVAPIYPKAAREAGTEGDVIVKATINTEGKVISVKILRSIPLLDQAAIDAVRQWVYKPMVVNNKPLGGVVTVSVSFRLK